MVVVLHCLGTNEQEKQCAQAFHSRFLQYVCNTVLVKLSIAVMKHLNKKQ